MMIMDTPLCTRDEIAQLVDDFMVKFVSTQPWTYFNRHIQDWPTHLSTMVSFWSSLLLKTADFPVRL